MLRITAGQLLVKIFVPLHGGRYGYARPILGKIGTCFWKLFQQKRLLNLTFLVLRFENFSFFGSAIIKHLIHLLSHFAIWP